jgi:hypothetical protein
MNVARVLHLECAMHHRSRTPSSIALIVAIAAVCGCSGSSPISGSPLQGTVQGAPFRAQSAALFNEPQGGNVYVVAFDTTLSGCQWPASGGRNVQVHLPASDWKTDALYSVDSGGPLTASLDGGGVTSGPNSSVSASATGQLEVVLATAQSNDTGVVRLRLNAEVGSDSVEGQVTVTDCRD